MRPTMTDAESGLRSVLYDLDQHGRDEAVIRLRNGLHAWWLKGWADRLKEADFSEERKQLHERLHGIADIARGAEYAGLMASTVAADIITMAEMGLE